MIFFTSDTHLFHSNIIKYCKRPFKDVFEMNEEIVKRWNEVVSKEDTVFHLGDFMLYSKTREEAAKEIMSRLNGTKHLVLGNHDGSNRQMKCLGFDSVSKVATEKIAGLSIRMTHVPDFNSVEHEINLCGHVHDAWLRKGNVINVGVDVWDFKPRTLFELLQK